MSEAERKFFDLIKGDKEVLLLVSETIERIKKALHSYEDAIKEIERLNSILEKERREKIAHASFLWDTLKEHVGHNVEIAVYGDLDNPASVTLEDMDTNEIILDAEIYTICPRREYSYSPEEEI